MEKKKEILSYWVRHDNSKLHYFKWSWDMIWVLIKYKIFYRMNISFTCLECGEGEYLVQFFAD